MSFVKNRGLLLTLCVMLLLLAACSSAPQQPLPPLVVAPPSIPKLSPELRKEPLPSGSYWARVIKWRKTWEETLKTLPPR